MEQAVFEVQFMPALIGQLKVPKKPCAIDVFNPHNAAQDNARSKQFALENNKYSLQTSDSSIHERTCEILAEDTGLQEHQRRTFMAAVNQMHDVTIEFGAVMVFSCSKSCRTEMERFAENGTYLGEFCLVEADPDVSLFQ